MSLCLRFVVPLYRMATSSLARHVAGCPHSNNWSDTLDARFFAGIQGFILSHFASTVSKKVASGMQISEGSSRAEARQ